MKNIKFGSYLSLLDPFYIRKDGENSPTSNIDWGAYKITNLANPESDQDAATKYYVDQAISGENWWDRTESDTTLRPHYLNDDINIGLGSYYGDGSHLSGVFYLDQTTPQTVINGSPTFYGLNLDNASNASKLNVRLYAYDPSPLYSGITAWVDAGFFRAGTHIGGDGLNAIAVDSGGNFTSFDSDLNIGVRNGYDVGGLITIGAPSSVAKDSRLILGTDVVRISSLTSNGFLKTGSSNGTLSVDSNTYLTSDDLSGYWKNDGTATATGDWDIGGYSFNAKNIYYDALKNNYLGDSATPSLTTGHDNFFVNGAGAKITTGYDSIGIGDADTLKEMTTSNRNIGIGVGALGGLTTNLYNQNVGVGTNAGRYYSTSTNARPARSMYLGHYTQASGAVPTNENVFGYSAIGRGSSTFVFGQKGASTKYYLYGDWINEVDGSYIALGAAEDMKIYYDGTNAIINPKAVGSGILDIQGRTQVDGLNIEGTVLDSTSSTALQIHQKDENVWAMLLYNDVYGSSTPLFSYFAWDSGKFAQGTEVNTDLAFYTNGFANERLIIKNDGKILVNDKIMFTQTDGNEYIDSLADGYMDYGATTGHRFNNDVAITGNVSATNLSGTNTGDQDLSGLVAKVDTRTIRIDGDFYGLFRVSSVKKISPPDLGFGYTITNVVVQCASDDPTTEFAGDLKWCDAQGTGAFPSTNPTVIKVLDTTTGNYDSGAITENVATGKELYIEMDSATDYGVMWTITITYQLRTS